MSLFKNALKANKEEEKTKKNKGRRWMAGDPAGDNVARSVKALVALSAEAKAIEAKMGIHKQIVKNYAEDQYIRDYAADGSSPETPMVIQTSDGEKVTYVVQDRSGQYKVQQEQKDALAHLLGPEAAEKLVYDEVSFSFNRGIMAIPGVLEVIEKALEGAVRKLTTGSKPILSEEQAGVLLDVDQKTAFRPGTLDRLTVVVGQDTGRIKQFLDIMGSSATRYIKT